MCQETRHHIKKFSHTGIVHYGRLATSPPCTCRARFLDAPTTGLHHVALYPSNVCLISFLDMLQGWLFGLKINNLAAHVQGYRMNQPFILGKWLGEPCMNPTSTCAAEKKNNEPSGVIGHHEIWPCCAMPCIGCSVAPWKKWLADALGGVFFFSWPTMFPQCHSFQ